MDVDTPKDFFISYTQADRQWAEWIAWHLEEAGYRTIIQAWDFHAGGNFVLDMHTATLQAERTIAVLSPDYAVSRFTSAEWAAAFRHDPKGEQGLLVPVRVRPYNVEGLLGQIVYIDLVDQDEAMARDTLLAGIQRQRHKPVRVPGFPALPGTQPERPSFPGALPSIWNVPYPRNAYFTGREEVLERLARTLHPEQHAAVSRPQAINGLGGIGKTQLALEYTYRYHQDYQAVLWSGAETREALISGFVALADLLQMPQKDEQDQIVIVKAVKAWLRSHSGWLLILDNADDLSLVREFLPEAGGGHILLTTRAQAMGRLADRIELTTLSKEAGARLLLARAGLLSVDASLEYTDEVDTLLAMQLCQELGGLPLALDQAGSYIEETQYSLQQYLDLYRHHRTALLAHRGGIVQDHPDSIATTWELSFAAVAQRSTVAADLLQLCTFLHPDAIPEEVFLLGAAHLGPRLSVLDTDPLAFPNALSVITSYSLLWRNSREQTLSIHRLVQAVLHDAMTEQQREQWIQRAISALDAVFPNDTEVWKQCERLLPHVLTCAAAVPLEMHNLELASLLSKTAAYLCGRVQYDQTETLYQRALNIREQALGPEHPDVAYTLNALADLYRTQDKFEQAKQLYKRALLILEQTLGPEHPEYAYSLMGLAILYYDKGKYEQSESLFKRALHILEQALGSEHPDVASSLHKLAHLYLEQGKYEQAELLYQRVLHIREQTLGPEHSNIAYPLEGLANVYYEQGKYEQAEPLYQRALHLLEMDREHPDVFYPLRGLADLYRAQGKFEQAEPLYQRALLIWEQALGPEHSQIAYTLNGLADLYQAQGKYEQAEPLYQRALLIWEQAMGPENPDLPYSLNGLANLYRMQSKYEQAESLYQRALHLLEQALGPQHLRTIDTRTRLIQLLRQSGRLEEADVLEKKSTHRTMASDQQEL